MHSLQTLCTPAVCRRTNISTDNSKFHPFYFPLWQWKLSAGSSFIRTICLSEETVYLSGRGDERGTQTYCNSISVVLCCLVALQAPLCAVLLYPAVAALKPIYGSRCQRPNDGILLLRCWQQTNSDWHITFPKSQVTKISQNVRGIKKAKFVIIHATKAHGGSGCMAPLILNLGTRWR